MSSSWAYSAGSSWSSSSRTRGFSPPPRSPRPGASRPPRSIVPALVTPERPEVLSSSTFAMPCRSSCVVRLPVFDEREPGDPRVQRRRVPWRGGTHWISPLLADDNPPLITDKQQRVRHLSQNCQGSKGRKHG